MSEESIGRSAVEELVVETKKATAGDPAGKQEPKFKVGKLRANCMQLFKVTASTFDGAMYGHHETEMTIAEAGAVINQWLGRKE